MSTAKGFLSTASAALTDMLRGLATDHRLDKGQVLFDAGDPGDALFAVVDGALEISVYSEDGRKLSLDIMRPGAILGEITLFDPGPRTATATALEPTLLRRVRHSDVLIEIRNDLIADEAGQQEWADRLAPYLTEILKTL